MKKSWITIGIIAITAMFVSGCSKSQETLEMQEIRNEKGGDFHTVSFSFAKNNTETKTYISEGQEGASFRWSEDDATRFTLKENGNTGSSITLTRSSYDAKATLSATFATSSAPYTYTAFMAKNVTAGGDPKIPAAQTSTASTYDPDADILVANPREYPGPDAPSEVTLALARPVVINKMAIKGLTEGETISSVNISSDKNIIGYYDKTGTMASDWTGQSKEIAISTSQTVPASGEITVFFVSMPVDGATLSITVTSGNYLWTKTFNRTIDLKMNEVTVFAVSGLTRIPKANYSGTYALASTNAGNTYMALAYASGNNISSQQVSKEEGHLYYDPDDIASLTPVQVTLAKVMDSESTYYGMYTIVQNEKYLYAAGTKSGDNYLKSMTLGGGSLPSSAYWEISQTDGVWSVVASKAESGISNNMRMYTMNKTFTCYSSASYNAVEFIPVANVHTTPVITASNINISADAVPSTDTGVTFNSETNEVSVAKYSDADCTIAGPSWLTLSTSGSGASTVINYAVTGNDSADERIAYIKITASNTSGRSVNRVISITQSPEGLVLDFSFTSNPGGWPTENGDILTDKTYRLNDVDYTFKLKNVKQNSGYLMCTSTAVLGLPAIPGYRLSKIMAYNSSGCAVTTRVGVSSASDSASYITGGAYQTWGTKGSSYIYNLTSTSAGTVYYLYITNANCQLISLRLTYIEVTQ